MSGRFGLRCSDDAEDVERAMRPERMDERTRYTGWDSGLVGAGVLGDRAIRMWLRCVRLGILVIVGAVGFDTPCLAQGFPFSQRGATNQTVAFTEIAVVYSRPVARGRVLFGDSGVVRWNRIWHPGADSASRIAFSQDVLLEGLPLKAGTYSLWLVPRERSAWTLILSRASHVFHAPYPGESNDVLRVEVTPERGAHMETLAIYFPVVLRDEATLRVHWGDTIIPVRIKAPYRPEPPLNGGP